MKKVPVLFIMVMVFAGQLYCAPFRTVAVHTFSNLTGNEENEWIAEAFTNAVASKLAHIVELNIVNRESLQPNKAGNTISTQKLKEKDAQALAKLAGVDYLVFGSVQMAGSLKDKNSPLRVHARIVDTTRGVIHQAIIVDGKLQDIYKLQYNLATQFLDMVKIEASVAELKSMQTVGTLSLEAYRLYNLGMIEKRKGNFKKAIEYFEQAMKKHPGILYADAHYQIGQSYLKMGRNEELLKRFTADAATLSPVYYDLGTAYEKAGDYKNAVDAYKTFLRYTDTKAVLWEYPLLTDSFKVVSTIDNPYFVCEEDNSYTCINSANGIVLWKRPFSSKGTQKTIMTNEALYVKEGDKIWRVDCATGKMVVQDKMPENETTSKFKKADMMVVVTEKSVEVTDTKNKKSVWNFSVQGKDSIVGFNNDIVCISQGSRKILGIRIMKNVVPTDAEGLMRLGACLKKMNKDAEATEVYRYLKDYVGKDNQ